MKYVSLQQCKEIVFPYIYEQLSGQEPSAHYEEEQSGLNELEKVLHLVENNSFYPGLQEKGAYLLCSIAGSQYFSNGNKRLGVVTLLYFFILNDVELRILPINDYQKLLKKAFPEHTWEENIVIGEANPTFLYNLAIIVGDRKQWGEKTNFDTLKQRVSELFHFLYRLPTT